MKNSSIALEKITTEIRLRNKNNEKYPVWSVTNDQGLVNSKEYFSKQVHSKKLTNYKIIEPNELAYNPSRINVGSIAVNSSDEKGILSPLYIVVKTKNNLLPKYLYYFLTSKEGNIQIRHHTQGSVRDSLSYENFSKIKIPLPSTRIQQKIIDILNCSKNILESREKAINYVSELINSIFLKEFGTPDNNNKGFEERTINEICTKTKYGTSIKCDYPKTGFPVLRIPNVQYGKIILKNMKYTKNEKEFKKNILKKNEILLVRTNGNRNLVGRCSVYDLDEEMAFASYLIKLEVSKEINPYFLTTYLRSDFGRTQLLSKTRTTAGQYNINTEGIKSVKILVPPRHLQDDFIEFKQHLDSLVETYTNCLINEKEIFDNLQNSAFKNFLVS